jgi:hypothetical protein
MWRGEVGDWRWDVWLEGKFAVPPARQHRQRFASSQALDHRIDGAPLRKIQFAQFERWGNAALYRQQPAPATKLDHLDDIREAISGCHSGLCHCATLALHGL